MIYPPWPTMPTNPKQTRIDCAKCGRLILDNLGEHTITDYYEAAQAHTCPSPPPPHVTFLEYRQ